MSLHVSTPRIAAAGLCAVALAAATLTAAPATIAPSAAADGADPRTARAPALLTELADRQVAGSRRGVVGDHLRVRLDASTLPERAAGQRLALPLGAGTGHVRIATVDRAGDHTAWAGALEGDRLSSFSLVRAGDTFRGSLVSPAGTWSLTRADGGSYWWSEVEPRRGAEGDDSLVDPHLDHGDGSRGIGADWSDRRSGDRVDARGKRRARINLLFGYTKAVRAEAGGRAALEAAAALVVSQTNETFRNSGLKVTVRYKGLVKARGKESGNAIKDLNRVYRTRDGRFDNLHRARRKKNADLVHLFTTGSQYDVCGAGTMPLSVRRTHPALAFSTSFYSCMPYLVATHELGHNLGADHIGYEGVSHDSKIPYAYGYYNVAGGYLSVMGYYKPCEDAQVYTCVRLPWLSSPTTTYNGQPLGVGAVTDNTRVVSRIAPRVARYMR